MASNNSTPPEAIIAHEKQIREAINTAKLPPKVVRPAQLAILLASVLLCLNFFPQFATQTRHIFVAVSMTFLGIGILIVHSHIFVSKTPLRPRGAESYIYYDQTPIKYLANVFLGLALGLILFALGLYGFLTMAVI